MSTPAELLEQLVDAIAGELAVRAGAGLAASAPVEQWRLATLEEAAAMMTRSERWVRERVKRGDLPVIRLDGGALAFDVDDLRAFAAARRVGSVDVVAPAASGPGRLRAVERGWESA